MTATDFVVEVDGTEIGATWLDESPETRSAIADALPVEGRSEERR